MRSKIMTKTQRLRMTIDITMTILSIILMGGNYLFPADIVHEILGVGLFFPLGYPHYFEPPLVCIARTSEQVNNFY